MAKMHLDETRQHYHIRECGNRVRVVITKTPHNTYVCYERLVDTGEVSEGQTVSRWEYVDGSGVGMGSRDPMDLAQRMYDDAPGRFGNGKLPFPPPVSPRAKSDVLARMGKSDLETYEAMLQRASMEWAKSEYHPGRNAHFAGQTLTQIAVQQSHNRMGYVGFTSNHFFNQDGALVAVGGYES